MKTTQNGVVFDHRNALWGLDPLVFCRLWGLDLAQHLQCNMFDYLCFLSDLAYIFPRSKLGWCLIFPVYSSKSKMKRLFQRKPRKWQKFKDTTGTLLTEQCQVKDGVREVADAFLPAMQGRPFTDYEPRQVGCSVGTSLLRSVVTKPVVLVFRLLACCGPLRFDSQNWHVVVWWLLGFQVNINTKELCQHVFR